MVNKLTTVRVAVLAVSLSPLAPVSLVACGGGTSPEAPMGGHDAGATAPPDAGVRPDAHANTDSSAGDSAPPTEAGASYPAFAPIFAQLVDNGGYVMKNPVVVSITWDSDPQQAYFDGFADNLGGTAYWNATTSEYGIHAATSGHANHVHMATTAATTTDQELQNMIVAHAGVDWPAPTLDTAYVYFLPPTLTLLYPVDVTNPDAGMENACQAFGGYHDQIQVGSVLATYAVVPSCITPAYDPDSGLIDFDAMAEGGMTAVQNSTIAMSHELVEMTTDPHPSGTQQQEGYIGLDNFALDWFLNFYDESGDLCVYAPNANIERVETTPAPFDYWVQRTWSNKAGPRGHDPCQPGLAGVSYFNVTPLHLDTLTIHVPDGDGGVVSQHTQGVHIPIGGTATIPLGFYSDGPTGGAWDLSYQLGGMWDNPAPTYLTVAIDNPAGQNGDVAHATVTVSGTDSTYTGLELLVFVSQGRDVAQTTNYMPVLISSQ
jgi:hypothetical protein